MSKEIKIGSIRNYYGGLAVKLEDGKYFWSIEDHGGHIWEEIPEELYRALLKYNEGARRTADAKAIRNAALEEAAMNGESYAARLSRNGEEDAAWHINAFAEGIRALKSGAA